MTEAEYWRRVAFYLADCHAANGYDATLKSCSKARRNRFASIMKNTLRYLKFGEQPPQYDTSKERGIVERLERQIADIEKVRD